MIPIYEQGKGRGIDLSARAFHKRFLELCQDHVKNGRAKAFAFLFYNFHDQEFRTVLRNQGVFTQLDRLAGDKLSIFYLHSIRRKAVSHFNSDFTTKLGLGADITLPCVVFFKLKGDQIEEVAAVSLESANLIHGFHELYTVIERYIQKEVDDYPKDSKYIHWLKSGTQFVSIELFRALLRSII